MIRILADNNADGHVAFLVRLLISDEWIDLWNALNLATVEFENLELPRDADDAKLWRTCQQEQVILITSNRNASGPDSLESTIRNENRPDCLPVFTLSDAERIRVDRDYAERTAESLLEYLMRLDEVRGTGRIFIP
jgi:hypothetical protein